MNWYYSEDGKQAGPLSQADFEALVQSGRIQPDTLVWREGMPNWLPYQQVAGLGAPVPPASLVTGEAIGEGGNVICDECGNPFPPDHVVRYGTVNVCANCKPLFLQKMQEGAALAPGVEMDYAGFWIRFVAAILDGIILGVPLNLFIFLVFGFDPQPSIEMTVLVQGLSIGISAAYEILFLGRYGATPGKMILRIKVVMADGSPVSYGRATGRFFAEILSGLICLIGYIIAAFDEEKRALHDHICNTRVIRR